MYLVRNLGKLLLYFYKIKTVGGGGEGPPGPSSSKNPVKKLYTLFRTDSLKTIIYIV